MVHDVSIQAPLSFKRIPAGKAHAVPAWASTVRFTFYADLSARPQTLKSADGGCADLETHRCRDVNGVVSLCVLNENLCVVREV